MTAPGPLVEVPSSHWDSHPLLRGLESGSDLDGDGAWFATWQQSPIPLAALDAIVVEERAGDGPWRTAARADGASFPSRGWAIANVGWYRPIWAFTQGDKKFESRALVPASWDTNHPTPQAKVPLVAYFTDWRTRSWSCDCGWVGTNAQALVFHDRHFVSVACPVCAHGIGTIDRNPSPDVIREAAILENPEALARLNPDDFGDQYLDSEGDVVFVTGHEEVVYFEDGDQFFGVPEQWLLPRLRLNPEAIHVDLFERTGFHISIDNELIEDIEPSTILGDSRGELCSYGNGDIIGGRFDLYDEWIEAWAPEIRWNLTWIGDAQRDLRDLALEKIVEGKDTWEPQSDDLFEVTSPYLDATTPEDAAAVVRLSGEAGRVTLNGIDIGE